MTSVLNVDTIAAKDGTSPVALMKQSAAKAWLGYAQDSSQSIVGDTFNVSGFTDEGTGNSTHTLTNNMNTGANTYSVQNTAALQYPYVGQAVDSGTFRLRIVNSAGSSADGAKNGAVHGDLA